MPKPAKKINLGIDAKWFFNGPPSGHMVVKNLVDEMVKNNNGRFKIYLFLSWKSKKQAQTVFSEQVKTIFLPSIPNMVLNAYLLPLIAWFYGMDIVLFQNFGSLWPGKLIKIAYIHDVLFLDYPQYYSKGERLYFKNMKRLSANADLIITISKTEQQRLIENHVTDSKKTAFVYHGIDKDFKTLINYSAERIESVALIYKLPQRYLLYVGRINIRKNLINLIKSLSLLDECCNIPLVIVGDPDATMSELSAYINDNRLQDRVIFAGHVPEADLHVIYANATVFCFPSFAEGFGLPPLEAMRSGVPAIVSDRTAMPEVCGDAAVYINPDDPSDIAQKISNLLNNRVFYTGKVKEGIAYTRKFMWERSANKMLTLISEAYVNRESH